MFVNRLTGLQLLGVPGVTAETAGTTPTPAAPAVCATDVKSEFVGWGYLRLFKTDIPAGTATQIDTYAVPEAQDPTYATGFGDFTAGHVAIDPRKLIYATFFLGVTTHTIGDKNYVRVTDQNFLLYIFDI
jgi:hypothetical protein